MTKLITLFAAPKVPRTVQAIRSKAIMEQKVKTALTNQWTMSRIIAKYRVHPDYIRDIADRHGLSVERPSDHWVERT